MKNFTVCPYFDPRTDNGDGLREVKIRVYHRAKSYYLKTDIYLIPSDWEIINNPKKLEKSPRFQRAAEKIREKSDQAKAILNSLSTFDMKVIRSRWLGMPTGSGQLAAAFQMKILSFDAKQISTKENYLNAVKAIERYDPDFKKRDFQEITPDWLFKWENHMIDQEGRKINTFSIYVRCLRHLMKSALRNGIITENEYPFHYDGYLIPTESKNKRSITTDTLKEIMQQDFSGEPNILFARDFLFLLYLLAGINIGDILRAKWAQVQGDYLYFFRQKNSRKARRSVREHKVFIPAEAFEIVKKYSETFNTRKPDTFIFPLLNGDENEIETRRKIKNTTRHINQALKKMTRLMGIKEKITTYTSRHTVAQSLKEEGLSVSFIKDFLGHADERTTQIYLSTIHDNRLEDMTRIALKKVLG